MRLRRMLKTITNMALAALIVVPFGHPSAGGQSARESSVSSAQAAPLSYLSVFGDFDGDRLLDQAQPHSAGAHRCILVRFGNSLESHLEFGDGTQSDGALLARDINHDNKADLIWIYQSRSEPPIVWLSDGLGSFAKAEELNNDADLRGMLSGDSSPSVAGDMSDDRACLAPQLVSSELPRAQNLEQDTLKPRMFAGTNCRRDLGIFLSSLQERGPPSFNNYL